MVGSITAVFDVDDPERSAGFWGALLGRTPRVEADGALLPGTPTQVGLRFAPAAGPSSGRPWAHLHLTSETPADQVATVQRVLALGGRHHDVGQRPDEGHVVLADPEGVELCVIEAGNRYLAGCGPLGEVAGDGTRALGLFWSAALDWPLVWDQDGETAVQHPAGGTKVAWGGEAPEPGRPQRLPQRLELDAGPDPAADVERLVALGAVELGPASGGVELVDPDGSVFLLRGTVGTG